MAGADGILRSKCERCIDTNIKFYGHIPGYSVRILVEQ